MVQSKETKSLKFTLKNVLFIDNKRPKHVNPFTTKGTVKRDF